MTALAELVRRCWLTAAGLVSPDDARPAAPAPAEPPRTVAAGDALPLAPHGFLVEHNREWNAEDPLSWTKHIPRTLPDCDCSFCLANHVHHPWVPQ